MHIIAACFENNDSRRADIFSEVIHITPNDFHFSVAVEVTDGPGGPDIAAALDEGRWTKAAEEILLESAGAAV